MAPTAVLLGHPPTSLTADLHRLDTAKVVVARTISFLERPPFAHMRPVRFEFTVDLETVGRTTFRPPFSEHSLTGKPRVQCRKVIEHAVLFQLKADTHTKVKEDMVRGLADLKEDCPEWVVAESAGPSHLTLSVPCAFISTSPQSGFSLFWPWPRHVRFISTSPS